MDEFIHDELHFSAESSKQASVQDRLSVWLAEYQALRTEIEWLIRDANQYQNFAIALLGAVTAAIAWVFEKAPTLIVHTLLVVPFLFCLLGFLFFRQHEEVYVIAAYLREYVRPQLRLLTKDKALWGWEEFKARRTSQLYKRSLFKALSTSKMVLVLRTLLFLIPSILSLFAIIINVTFQGVHQFVSNYGTINTVFIAIGFFFDVIVVLLLIRKLFTQSDLQRRILALESSEVESEGNKDSLHSKRNSPHMEPRQAQRSGTGRRLK